VFSVFANPAAATGLENNNIGLFFDHRYNLAGLSNLAIAGNYNLKHTSLLVGVSRYGDDLLNQSRCELAIAHKIRNVSLAGGAGYQQIMVAENGSARNVTFQFGGIAKLTPNITYGAHIFNLSRSKVSKEKSIYYPVIMRMGFSYAPIKQVFISAEIEKDSRFNPNFKAGVEYRFNHYLFFRTGINSNPATACLGFGFKLKEWMFDYALAYHNRLGLVHNIGLVFSLPKSQSEPVTLSTTIP